MLKGFVRRYATATIVLVTSLSLVASACGNNDSDSAGEPGTDTDGEPAPREPQPLDLALASGSLAYYSYFAADTLGYFEDEGFDVNIVTTGGSAESAQLVASGRADAGDATVETLLATMAQADLYPFYNQFIREYRGWVAPADSGVTEIADLAGTTVGVSSLSGGEVPMVRYLLEEAGIADSVEVVAASEEPPIIANALESGRIGSYAGSTSTIIGVTTGAGLEVTNLLPPEFQEGPIAPLFTSEEHATDTEMMTAIARSVSRGALFCLTNPDGCLAVIGEERPELVEDPAVAAETLAAYFEFTRPPEVDGRYRFGGAFGPEAYAPYLAVASSGPEPLIENPESIDLDRLIVPLDEDAINDFDYDAVVEEATNYPTE